HGRGLNMDIAALSANAEAVGLSGVVSRDEFEVYLRGQMRHLAFQNGACGRDRTLAQRQDRKNKPPAQNSGKPSPFHAGTSCVQDGNLNCARSQCLTLPAKAESRNVPVPPPPPPIFLHKYNRN